MKVWLINSPSDAPLRGLFPLGWEVTSFATSDFEGDASDVVWALPSPPFHHEDDPQEPDASRAWPFNNMAPAAARSVWIADQCQRLAREQVAPNAIVAGEDPIDIYFLRQKQLTDPEFLPETKIIAPEKPLSPNRDFTFPQYWLDEMRRVASAMVDLRWSEEGHSHRSVRLDELPAAIAEPHLPIRPDSFPFADPELRRERTANPTTETEGPLLTVAIPCYKLGQFVEEAVDSALAATDITLRVWLIDDGSPDAQTQAVLDRLEARSDHRLQITRRENHGLAATRNFAAENATSPYLAFLDADDAVEPAFFSRAVELLEQYRNVHWVSSWVRFFGAGHGIWHAWNTTLPYFLAHNLLIPICVVRRESFLAHGRNNPAMRYGLEDFEGWLSMVEAGCGGIAIPEVLTRYRIRERSMFQSIDRARQHFLYDVIVREHPALYQKFGAELFRLQNANGPAWAWDQPTCYRDPDAQLRHRAAEGQSALQSMQEREEALAKAQAAVAWHQQDRENLMGQIAALQKEVAWRKSMTEA